MRAVTVLSSLILRGAVEGNADMPRAEEHGPGTRDEQVALLMMREVRISREDPETCRTARWGAMREEIGPPSEPERAPGIPFLHSDAGSTRDVTARALAKLCRFCGACEMAAR